MLDCNKTTKIARDNSFKLNMNKVLSKTQSSVGLLPKPVT